jgi:hypothetical protein
MDISGVSTSILMRLALMNVIGYKVTEDERVLFRVADLHKAGDHRRPGGPTRSMSSSVMTRGGKS